MGSKQNGLSATYASFWLVYEKLLQKLNSYKLLKLNGWNYYEK